LYGQKGRKYAIADPGFGIRYVTREELTEGWSNLNFLDDHNNWTAKSSLNLLV
jgi:ABC-type bacteriocin/lantibiotic exporter with double-glycine peptidase domain